MEHLPQMLQCNYASDRKDHKRHCSRHSFEMNCYVMINVFFTAYILFYEPIGEFRLIDKRFKEGETVDVIYTMPRHSTISFPHKINPKSLNLRYKRLSF